MWGLGSLRAADLELGPADPVSVRQGLRRQVAALLERRAPAKRRLAWMGAAWARFAEPARPLRLPTGVHTIGVAGATLGGSGATPFAIALCEALAARGVPVAFVAHGYEPGRRAGRAARRALPSDSGADEARLAARKLAPLGVPVFVARQRQAALDAAARALPRGGVTVLDGALQARPARFSESLLVVDAQYPWGSGVCPPLGDLRAPSTRLLGAERVFALDRGGELSPDLPRRAQLVQRLLLGVRNARSGERRPLSWLAQQDFHLALALARPERLRQQLMRAGVRARWCWEAADHVGLAALLTPEKSSLAECVVCSEKCWEATAGRHAQLAARAGGRVWILEERLELPTEWLDLLVARFAEPSRCPRASDRFDDSQRTGQRC